MTWIGVILCLLWLGRVSLIKMNILPHMGSSHTDDPHSVFKQSKNFTSWLSSFIRSKRRPKLKMSTLQLPGCEGGLDLPNIRVYQLCCHLKYIYDWIINDPNSIWLDTENSQSMI